MIQHIGTDGSIHEGTKRFCSKCNINKFTRGTPQRNREKDKVYNKNWKQTVKAVDTRDKGLCRLCLEKGHHNKTQARHHIVPIEDNKDLWYDINNVISLCMSCHMTVESDYRQSESKKREVQLQLQDIVKKEI